jgi:hypothetical protein
VFKCLEIRISNVTQIILIRYLKQSKVKWKLSSFWILGIMYVKISWRVETFISKNLEYNNALKSNAANIMHIKEYDD